MTGKIEFKDVWFRYPTILTGTLRFNIDPCEKIACLEVSFQIVSVIPVDKVVIFIILLVFHFNFCSFLRIF